MTAPACPLSPRKLRQFATGAKGWFQVESELDDLSGFEDIEDTLALWLASEMEARKTAEAEVERERKVRARLVKALEKIDTFAWTAVEADCEAARVELNRRIAICRAALAAAKSQQPISDRTHGDEAVRS